MSYFFKMTFTAFSYFVFCTQSIGIVTYANISTIKKKNPKLKKKIRAAYSQKVFAWLYAVQ